MKKEECVSVRKGASIICEDGCGFTVRRPGCASTLRRSKTSGEDEWHCEGGSSREANKEVLAQGSRGRDEED